MDAEIYQIFYNQLSQEQNDQGFLQLDNLSNERPDWSEYWPIRNYLLANELADDRYYGFLSPKFKSKTNLASEDVFRFIDSRDYDVILFSPYFDQSAFFLNVFEQAATNHVGIYPALAEAFQLLDSKANLSTLVMSSKSTVFCNYFVAKKRFWEVWFSYCEKIFAVCEANDSDLASKLNASVGHSAGFNPAKVFVTERVASFLLATRANWKVKVYSPMQLPYGPSWIAKHKAELVQLDALKMAYVETGFQEYIQVWVDLRAAIMNHMK